MKTLHDEQHLKFCHFQPVHCASKNNISPEVFTRSSRSLSSSKMLMVGIWVECFNCAGILLLQWQSGNFAHRQHLKLLPLSTCTLWPAKTIYRQRYSHDFRDLCRQLEDVEGGHLGGKIQVCRTFTFEIAR